MQLLSRTAIVSKRTLPWLVMLAVVVIHFGVTWAWFEQMTFPSWSYHNNQMNQAVVTMVLTGRSRVQVLPASSAWQVPADEEGIGRWGVIRSSFDCRNDVENYFTRASLFDLLSSLPSVVLGLRPITVQVGTVVPLVVFLVAMFLAARSIMGPAGATAAAVFVTMLPVTIGAMRTAWPVLGFMIAPTIAVCALLSSDRFRRRRWVVAAAVLTILATRWGESAGDVLRVLFAIACVAGVLGASLFLPRTERKTRGLTWFMIYGALVLLLLDKDWLVSQSLGYILPQAAASESSLHLLNPARLIVGFAGGLAIIQEMMLGLPATLVVLAGVTILLVRVHVGEGDRQLRITTVPAFRRSDRNGRVHLVAILAWFVMPLLFLSLSSSKQAANLLEAIPPLAILTVAGLLHVRRIGRYLPWVGILVVVPSYICLNSPDRLRTLTAHHPASAEYGAGWALLRHGLSSSTVDPLVDSEEWHGIRPTPLVTFYDSQGTSGGEYEHVVEAWDWSSVGPGSEFFEAMPRGTVVVAVSGGPGPFEVIGSMLQATYPDVVFRSYISLNGEPPPEFIGGLDPTRALFATAREFTYVLMFRNFDTGSGPPSPPRPLGRTVEIARGDELALYRIVIPPRGS